jgi:beta-N-acetylhexosaminidase
VVAPLFFALLALAVPRPHIVQKPIPYGPQRKAEMAAYAKRHYGIDSWRLVDPHVIVEHYTVTTTFAPVYAEFAADVPDTELHELPGVCAQFVIDTDGTIYQLVPLDVMCRHTVGLNYTAIGIEHVGMSDAQILDDPKEMASSLALTLWLMEKFHISIGNVIGHAQSLTSPYHRELYAPWRCQTHADWQPADMAIYRARLRHLAARYHAWVGAPYKPQPTGC